MDHFSAKGVELRESPHTGVPVFVVRDFQGDLFKFLTTPKKDGLIEIFVSGPQTVSVHTPKLALFHLEDLPDFEGDGVAYNRSPAFGAHELLLPSRHDKNGLEFLLHSIASRSRTLQDKGKDHHLLHQSYPVITIGDQPDGEMAAILLASRAIAPNIESELRRTDQHFGIHGRPMYADLAKEERGKISAKESRIVAHNDEYIAVIDFAPHRRYDIDIFQYDHTARLADLRDNQIRKLAELIYDCVRKIYRATRHSQFQLANVAIHQAPVFRNGSSQFYTRNPIESTYGLHVEITPGNIPTPGTEYGIPSSGWSVEGGRPKDTARLLRES